jgi:predicted site-specific integrase-resolvase
MTTQDVRLLTPTEVSRLFRVDLKTACRWAAAGRLLTVSTPGGRPRFFPAEVYALLRGEEPAKAREAGLAEQARMTGGGS